MTVSGTTLFGLADPSGGVFVSTNYGDNWVYKSYGLPNQWLKQIYALGTNIFVGSAFYGVFHSSNNGTNWSPANNWITNLDVNALFSNGNNLYAGTEAGAFLSANNGESWNSILPNKDVRSFAMLGTNLLAGCSNDIFLTSNNGTNWVSIKNGYNIGAFDIVVLDSTIFVSFNGIQKSTNNGLNWYYSSNGLPQYSPINTLVKSGTTLYVGTEWVWNRDGGMYYSTNDGDNWYLMGYSSSVNTVLASGTNIYIGTYSGILLTTNHGTNWILLNNGLSSLNIQSLTFSGSYLFAGTNEGIYLSVNNGTNWLRKNQGFNFNPIIHTIYSKDNFIFCGAGGRSVWRRSLSEIIEVKNTSSVVPDKFSLSQNYPNPFNPTTNIKYQITNNLLVTIKVFDILGKEIETLVNEKLNAGEYEVQFPNDQLANVQLPSGFYFYSLFVEGNLIDTKKMILLK